MIQQPRLSLYTIDMKYVRNLSKVDNNVMSTSPQVGKSNRPFVGILILLNNRSYCIPLTSPKPKFQGRKNSVDFIKITHPTEKNENGAFKMIGALNLNNMLPVDLSVLKKIDLQINKNDTMATKEYKELMKDQLNYCQINQDIILKRANSLYNLVTKHPDKNRNLVRRCCNFKKLEQVLDKYIIKTQAAEKQSSSIHKQTSPLSRNTIKKNAKTISNKHSEQQPIQKDKSHNKDLS